MKRKSRILLPAALLIMASGSLLLVFLHLYLPGMISGRVEREISIILDSGSGGLFTVQVDKPRLSIFPWNISFPRISLQPDQTALTRTALESLPSKLYKAEITDLQTSLRSLIKAGTGTSGRAGDWIYAGNISLTVFENQGGIEHKNLNGEAQTGIRLHSAVIDNIELEQRYMDDGQGMVVMAANIEFNENRVKANGRNNLHAHEPGTLRAGGSQIFPGGSLHEFKADSIFINLDAGTINIYSPRMIPLHGKPDYHNYLEFQTERIEARFDSITAMGFNIDNTGKEPVFSLATITLDGGKIDVFRDRRPPFDEQQRPQMPSRLIGNASAGFYIGNIGINGTEIIYSEFPQDADPSEFDEATGRVNFSDLNAGISNVTNLADSLVNDSIMRITASAEIFDAALLSAEFRYNLRDINGGYTARGTLEEMEFRKINTALYPLAGIKVEGGLHHGSEFNFAGNDYRSEGELYMFWSDLLLELAPEAGEFAGEVARFAGKTFLYRPSGGRNNDDASAGEIYFERDNTRFVFHYWWNCYLTGILDNVLRDLVPYP